MMVLPTGRQDGNEIVFASERDGDKEIYVIEAAGLNLVQLTNEPGYDGDLIGFSSDRDSTGSDRRVEIYVTRPDGIEVAD